ncbi:MAG: Na+/H+ antiporter NhaC family protein [bacterium]|nr:Na+/H+ antiporter NhaC family protein [bacterium]
MQSIALSLLPILVFLGLFVGTGIYFYSLGVENAFYQVSPVVAMLPAVILALVVGKKNFQEKLTCFVDGLRSFQIVYMVLIYLLAGAFGALSKASGGVDAVVNLGLTVLPSSALLPSFFIITALLSTAMGSSMGTIAALMPAALALVEPSGVPLALTAGIVVGGAMFGDNLSFVSDTTIAATQTQGCSLRDKFKANVWFALTAMSITLVFLSTTQTEGHVIEPSDINFFNLIPYAVVVGLALWGVDVLVVLASGCFLFLILGALGPASLTFLEISKTISAGFASMHEILILTLLVGGLGALVEFHGGIHVLMKKLRRVSERAQSPNKKTFLGEISIVGLAIFTNLCTANNTVSILLSGPFARQIATQNAITKRRTAGLLDIFTSTIQGIIPYGAQILLAASIAHISPLEVVGCVHYCYILGGVTMVSVVWKCFRKSQS